MQFTPDSPLPRDIESRSQAVGGEGSLPVWDLSDLYAGPADPALEADLQRSTAESAAFQAAYAGKLADLPGDALAAAIATYERIEEVLGRLGSYAGLLFATDSTDPVHGKFYQSISERTTEVGTHLLFFTLELNALEEAHLDRLLEASPALARWAPFLRDLRVFRPHQLPDEVQADVAVATGDEDPHDAAPDRRPPARSPAPPR